MSDGDLRYVEDQTGGRLGRNVIWHDPANRAYPATGVLFRAAAPLRPKTWWRRGVWDQGYSSECSPHSAAGVRGTSPFRKNLPRPDLLAYDDRSERTELYAESQKVDPWPGESYDGTSTDAPFKVMRSRGHIREWRWCFGADDVLRALSHHGPVSIGTNWYEGMETPKPNGFVSPSGDILGGHAYELLGIDVDDEFVTAVNSWGPTYGRNGRFRISFKDLRALLEGDGEAVTVVL